MFKRLQPQQEEIHVNYNPPADGSYPPRLVMLDNLGWSLSIWLDKDGRKKVILDEFDIERKGDVCRLIPLNPAMSDVLVNGQPMMMAGRLSDGDFIQSRKLRAVFQVDPVKDRRLWMEKTPDVLHGKMVKLSRRLKKWAVINEQGISFDGGQHFARWDEIEFVSFRSQAYTNTLEMYVTQDGESGKLQNKLMDLDRRETNALMDWLKLSLPFDLCALRREPLSDYFPDAYYAAAYEKIYLPSLKNQHILPADENFILGIEPFGKQVWRIVRSFLICVLLGAAFWAFGDALIVDGDTPFETLWFGSFLNRLPVCGVYIMLLMVMIGFKDGVRWVRRVFREKRWRRTDDQVLGN